MGFFFFSFSDPLSITCPDLEVTASGETGATVEYQEPQASASGGMPPYGIACSPPSGTLFSVSTRHTVTCTLRDAASTEKVCTFFVQVNGKFHQNYVCQCLLAVILFYYYQRLSL